MTASQGHESLADRDGVYLVGVGVVGRAILRAHIETGVSVHVADQDERVLRAAVAELKLDEASWSVSEASPIAEDLPAIELRCLRDSPAKTQPIVIESVAEKLDVKQRFFVTAERLFGGQAILCSNTSNLRIGEISTALAHPERLCGMHFFMPVDQRPAVEIVRAETTSRGTVDVATRHAMRIGKHPLVVGDGPGFIVNRLLSPYLNEAMLMLGRGVSAAQIERAALTYGMPISPLELIDWIGTRTMFDAGRVFWQSFPNRIDPAPILTALIKRRRSGRADTGGLYDYDRTKRSAYLSPLVVELIDQYLRDEAVLSDDEVMRVLSIPMWIEGALALRDGIAESCDQIEQAMCGGLGFDADKSWLGFFDDVGSDAIMEACRTWSSRTAAMTAPPGLIEWLGRASPTDAMTSFANGTAGHGNLAHGN